MGKYDDAIGSIEFKISVQDVLDEALQEYEGEKWDGSRLKKMRKERQLTQKAVQVMTGIDQAELSKMERGDRSPTLEQLAKLARLYETNMDYLAFMTDEIKPYPERIKEDC